MTASELKQRYSICLACLSTLIGSVPPSARDAMLRTHCERLKVPYRGTTDDHLEATLHGLVMRLLPTTVSLESHQLWSHMADQMAEANMPGVAGAQVPLPRRSSQHCSRLNSLSTMLEEPGVMRSLQVLLWSVRVSGVCCLFFCVGRVHFFFGISACGRKNLKMRWARDLRQKKSTRFTLFSALDRRFPWGAGSRAVLWNEVRLFPFPPKDGLGGGIRVTDGG